MGLRDNLSLEELRKLIEEQPLTEENVVYTLRNKIKRIILDDNVSGGRVIRSPSEEDQYFVWLGLDPEMDLIHEIAHVHYNVKGTGISGPFFGPERERKEEIEKMLEQEAQRFYDDNEDFVRQLCATISSNSANCT
jgi:hypothetical protein